MSDRRSNLDSTAGEAEATIEEAEAIGKDITEQEAGSPTSNAATAS